MASDTWTTLTVREETRYRHYLGYSFWVLLYAPFHRQDSTYHSLCYTSYGMFYLTMYSTHFIYGYMASYMVKDHSARQGNPLLLHGLLFLISSKGSFICTIPQKGHHISQHLLHQWLSTGWNERVGTEFTPCYQFQPRTGFLTTQWVEIWPVHHLVYHCQLTNY